MTPKHCRLCRSDTEDLDFHHWDYDHDVGVKICRECHDHIHVDRRVREQKHLSDSLGYSSWQAHSVLSTLTLDLANIPWREIWDIDSRGKYEAYFVKRYNLPDTEPFHEIWELASESGEHSPSDLKSDLAGGGDNGGVGA